MGTLISTGPLWTDKLTALATVVGVVGGLIALGLSVRQLRLQTRQLELQTIQDEQGIEIRLAQRGLDLMHTVIEVERIAVDKPELGPYLHEGKEVPAEEPMRSGVLAYASLFMGLAETVGWQIRVNQMTADPVSEWRRYFKGLYDTTPAVRAVVERDGELLADETRWLFGIAPVTGALSRLGFGE